MYGHASITTCRTVNRVNGYDQVMAIETLEQDPLEPTFGATETLQTVTTPRVARRKGSEQAAIVLDMQMLFEKLHPPAS